MWTAETGPNKRKAKIRYLSPPRVGIQTHALELPSFAIAAIIPLDQLSRILLLVVRAPVFSVRSLLLIALVRRRHLFVVAES